MAKPSRARAPRTPAAQTRIRILASSRELFCRAGFDQATVRELGAAAEVDPAVIIRLFGSKEALFAAVAAEAFTLEALFGSGPIETMGERISTALTNKTIANDEAGFDTFRFLLRSAASPTAAPILATALHAGFVAPLAARLQGEDQPVQAALLTACILGFTTLRVALATAPLTTADPQVLEKRFARILQACLDSATL